ncbi:MAG TPA: 8-amino-7-oxononanoate synthase, partial [Blastocatellia bacterium]|nr:8-amino-7-oxononanoate synthase [Blastocatellia bacterium]
MQQRSPQSVRDIFEKAAGFTKADEFRRVGLYPYFTEFSHGADSGECEVVLGDRRILMFGS